MNVSTLSASLFKGKHMTTTSKDWCRSKAFVHHLKMQAIVLHVNAAKFRNRWSGHLRRWIGHAANCAPRSFEAKELCMSFELMCVIAYFRPASGTQKRYENCSIIPSLTGALLLSIHSYRISISTLLCKECNRNVLPHLGPIWCMHVPKRKTYY